MVSMPKRLCTVDPARDCIRGILWDTFMHHEPHIYHYYKPHNDYHNHYEK